MKENKENQKIAIKDYGVVLPAMSGDEAVKVWAQYQDVFNKICTEEDYQIIKDKRFRKKSGWRKISTFFNLSLEVVEERREVIGKTMVWHFTCKAIAPTGRYSFGTGSCDAFEKAVLKDGVYKIYNKFKKVWEEAVPNSIHNIRTIAETRASNRAISNLVGGGEVSADEIVNVEDHLGNGEEKAIIADQQNKELMCQNCQKAITVPIYDYSMRVWGSPFCRDCQKTKKL